MTMKKISVIQCAQRLYASDEGLFIRIGIANGSIHMVKHLQDYQKNMETKSELSLISFVALELENLIFQLYKRSWMSICKLTQQRQSTINQMAMNPQQTYIAARQLLGINNIIAYPAGQFLSIYQCEIIKSYHFEQLTKCYKSIPIRYKKHNKVYKRFFIPSSMIKGDFENTIAR